MTEILYSLAIVTAALGVDVEQVESVGEQIWTIVDVVHRHHVDAPERLVLWQAVVPLVCTSQELAERRELAEEFNRTLSAREFGELLVTRIKAGKTSVTSAEDAVKSVLKSLQHDELGRLQLTRAKDDAVEEQLRNNRYVGLGVMLGRGTDDGYPQFDQILPGGAAERGGLKAGVTVLEVDGKPVRNVPTEELLDLLRGPLGSELTLKIGAGQGHPQREVTLTRGVVRKDSVLTYNRLPVSQGSLQHDSNPVIGWLYIPEISASTLHELRCVDRMVRHTEIRAMVIDFSRSGRAGDFHQAKLVADGLLSGGLIWTHHDRDSQPRRETADADSLFAGMPLVIIVSPGTTHDQTAIAAALQDAGRAVVVGGAPLFEGSVPTSVPISKDDVLQLPTFKIKRGRSDRSWPLIPDFIPISQRPILVADTIRGGLWPLVPRAEIGDSISKVASAMAPANGRRGNPAIPTGIPRITVSDSFNLALKVAQQRISEQSSAPRR